jgi:hypothetical protein
MPRMLARRRLVALSVVSGLVIAVPAAQADEVLLWTMVVTVTGIFRPDVSVAGPPAPARAACRECDEVISRVLLLLPERPDAIVVIDAARSSPALQQAIEIAEGFVTAGSRTVCLKKQGFIFQHALKLRGIWDYVLACVVWHEMAHIAGADEPEAQRREEQLWTQFIHSRKVNAGPGLRYLQLLRRRHRKSRAVRLG